MPVDQHASVELGGAPVHYSPRLSATTVYLHQITGGRATVIPACSIGAREKKMNALRNKNDNPVCNTRQPYKVGETIGPACLMVFWMAPIRRTSFFSDDSKRLKFSFVAPIFNLAYRWPLSSAIQFFIPAGCGGIPPHFSCSAVIKVTQIRKWSEHNFPVLLTRA